MPLQPLQPTERSLISEIVRHARTITRTYDNARRANAAFKAAVRALGESVGSLVVLWDEEDGKE